MNIVGHFRTITRHRHLVIKHCFMAGIGFQGLFHDLSKYCPSEFIPGVKYYLGNKSPNDKQRQLFGYSAAWLHHKGLNKHHFEYWYDYNSITKEIVPVKMPLKYVKEMFCDRLAASKVYQGKNYTDNHPIEYFETTKAKNYMHVDNAQMLRQWLTMLSEKGEKDTFAYIRKLK